MTGVGVPGTRADRVKMLRLPLALPLVRRNLDRCGAHAELCWIGRSLPTLPHPAFLLASFVEAIHSGENVGLKRSGTLRDGTPVLLQTLHLICDLNKRISGSKPTRSLVIAKG